MGQDLLTISQTADLLDVSRQTIYAWLKADRFPNNFEVGEGDGSITLIPTSDVEKVKQEEADKLVNKLNRLGFHCEFVPA